MPDALTREKEVGGRRGEGEEQELVPSSRTAESQVSFARSD